MNASLRTILLVAALALLPLLTGCPGMPGAGGGGGAAQNTPPGVLPPPGLESGGVRTLMGTTVTPPNDQILLVSYATSPAPYSSAHKFDGGTVRRLTFVDGGVLFEGLNYDERAKGQEKDRNVFLPLTQVFFLTWKYEPKPTPPASPTPGTGKEKQGPGPKRSR